MQEPILKRNNITLNIWYTTFNFSNFLFKITYKISDTFPSLVNIISRIVILHEDINYQQFEHFHWESSILQLAFLFFTSPCSQIRKKWLLNMLKQLFFFNRIKSCTNFELPPPTINKIQTVLCFVKIFDENSKFIILLQSTLVLQTSCYNVAFL